MVAIRSILVVACALSVMHAASAHICMWKPMQRGGFSIAGPVQNPCYRKVGPCGSDTKGAVTTIAAGSAYTVEFQQNANHFYTGNPGKLVVDWAKGSNPSEGDFSELASIQDYNSMGELTQTNFTRTVQIPKAECDECVLRLRYESNNPDEDPQHHGTTFYQCADVKFVASAQTEAAEPKLSGAADTPQTITSAGQAACCAPSSFTTSFTMDKPMTHTTGTFWYDSENHMMREELIHGAGNGTTATNGHFIIVSNFTSGDGYYVDVNTNECVLGGPFGLDLWNSWCFGSAMENEVYDHSGTCLSSPDTCNFYANGNWMFGATQDECFPSSIVGSNGNFGKVVYSNPVAGPIAASMWETPAACKKSSVRRLSGVELNSLSEFLAAVRK